MSYYNQGLAVATRLPKSRSANYRDGLLVGNALYHTVGDRYAVVNVLGTEFTQLANEVGAALGYSADPYHAMNTEDPRFAWWQSALSPLLAEWQAFQAEQTNSTSQRFFTNWDVYESWQARLHAARKSARDAGFELQSPEPQPLPTTLWDIPREAAHQTKDLIETMIWVGAVILGGMFVLQLSRGM